MKTLYLLRHAKSDWNSDYSADHNRPISKRGIRAATNIGKYAFENKIRPDIIMCSSSRRTRETIALVSENAQWSDIKINFEDSLYLARTETALGVIRAAPQSIDSLLLVGHQPWTGAVASRLLGGKTIDVPTACFIGIQLDLDDWSFAGSNPGKLVMHVLPRSLD